MKKKFNDINIQSLKTAFVVFESQSQANKCVKARSRHSLDGIRTMHKYDYNKVMKRMGKGSPSFAPVNARQGNNFTGMTPINNFQQNVKNQQKDAYVMKKHQPNQHNYKPKSFRSQKWRSPTKDSDSLNWRVNSPMRQRTNSTQNRSSGVAKGTEFSRGRFS